MLRAAARDAEAKAAQEQHKAVVAAVRAVEDVTKKTANEAGGGAISLRRPRLVGEPVVRVQLTIGGSMAFDARPAVADGFPEARAMHGEPVPAARTMDLASEWDD